MVLRGEGMEASDPYIRWNKLLNTPLSCKVVDSEQILISLVGWP